jgi:hypothetical protein
MRYLIIGVMVAIAAALVIEYGYGESYLPDIDENGYRCEGDCDPDVPCRYCNPRK